MAGPWEKYAEQSQAPASGPWDKYATAPVETAPEPEKKSLTDKIKQGAGDILAGAVRGAGSLGATVLLPADMINQKLRGEDFFSLKDNRARRAEIDEGLRLMGADTDSLAYQGGKLGAEIAGTLGVGGALANGARAAGAAPSIVNAIASSGMTTGAAPAKLLSQPGVQNMLTRMLGGAVTGGASAGLVDPDNMGTGAKWGAILPPALSATGAVARYAGNTVGSVIRPFTQAGQERIAGDVVRKFAEGGPTAVDARQLVNGSTPTLAEATGNAGLATLQRGARDLRPNAFIEREAQNAAARLSAFDDIAGDANAIAAARASRESAASPLYDAAKKARVSSDSELLKILERPSAAKAWERAQKLALEKGEKLVVGKDIPETVSFVGGKVEKVAGAHGHSKTVQLPGLLDSAGNPLTTVSPAQNAQYSGKGLHYLKMGIDDLIGDASSGIGKNEKAAILGTKEKLMSWLDKNIPEYGKASATYAEKSAPINAMETLQDLRLTDAQGNITLAKIQNAIRGLESRMSEPGVNAAKSVSAEQLGTLKAIRDDLLRQSNLGAGRSIGSNTFQNIATDNILATMLPGRLGGFAQGKIGGALGQVGRLAYSGPNEAIRNKIVDLMLEPELAQQALNATPQLQRNSLMQLLDQSGVPQAVYRAAPVVISR